LEGWTTRIGSNHVSLSRPCSRAPTHEIDVWVASSAGLLQAKSCLHLLTPKDLASLNHIQDPARRSSAIAARVLLRLALSRAVDRAIAPSEWKFAVGEHQRPIINSTQPQIKFSVSHVDQVVMVAVSRDLNVGVDVESVDQEVGGDVVAGFCHVEELEYVQRLSEPRRVREFMRLWTAKEAYTKMTGQGHLVDFSIINVIRPMRSSAARDRAGNLPFRFESFCVSINRELFHASLAIEARDGAEVSAEVRLINFVESGGVDPAIATPWCAYGQEAG
jgi:4'-phosphopantetheinyl transferase